MIFPCLRIDTIYANNEGKFRILVSSNFRGNLHYSHPDYNPYLERINGRSNKTLHVIDLLSDSFLFDTICYPTLPGNISYVGRVLSKRTRLPLEDALFQLKNQKKIGYSLNHGDYRVCVPISTDSLIISHSGYKTGMLSVNELKFTKKILMQPLQDDTAEFVKKFDKNSLRLMVNELLMGSVGIDYERFVKYRHSIGLKSSFFLYDGLYMGIPFNNAPTPKFTGIKLSPYYRYYFWRNPGNAGFLEGKVSWGYFDFEQIAYKDPKMEGDDEYYGKTLPAISRSLGFGGAFGWSLTSIRSHLILNFSIGLQYMSLNVPSTQYITTYAQPVKLVLDNPYWYVRVPGSVVELKFMIGGIF
jgi:hypothetical protein